MRPRTWQGLAGWLSVVVALGVAGWLLGSEVIAHTAQRPPTVVVEPAAPDVRGVGAGIIVPRSGLSPFGHSAGLPGRQVLVGRVVESDGTTLTLDWAGGRTRLRFAAGSDFLLRLVADREAPIEPGAAIALLVSQQGSELVARSGVLLPEASRPQIVPGPIQTVLAPEPAP